MTMAGWFNKFALLAIAVIIGAVLFFKMIGDGVSLKLKTKDLLIAGVIMISVIFLSLYVSPTIFSGRDQGSLSEAAVRLSQNHELQFSDAASNEFFKIYGPGKALNFPGFNYLQNGNLITQFPIGYVSWLAAFYSWFGLNGLIVANSISFLIFLIAFKSIADLLLKPNRSWMAIGFVLSGFIFIWINKFTLGENLAMAFLWVAIYEIMKYFRDENKLNLITAVLSLGLLLFVRIEALVFWIMLIILLLYMKRNHLLVRGKTFTKSFYLATFLILSAFVANLWIFRFSYLGFVKSIAKPFINGSGQMVQESIFSNWLYFIMILLSYSLLSFVIFGILGIFYSMRKKNLFIMIPFIIIVPTFIYLFFPSVSLDHPWMLRRFAFSIIPAVMLYTLVFFDIHVKRDWQFYFLTSLLIVSNLVISGPFITFVPYQGLREQVSQLSKDFRPNDLVLVDQMASGDNWSMITGPMGFMDQLQSVYLVNVNDIPKIDSGKFGRIFLMVSDDKSGYYLKTDIGSRMKPIRNYSFNYQMIGGGAPNYGSGGYLLETFPQKIRTVVHGKIYQLQN